MTAKASSRTCRSAQCSRRHAPAFRKGGTDAPADLTPAGPGELWPALITPPDGGSKVWQFVWFRPAPAAAPNTIDRQRPFVLRNHAGGGLPPRALRRVREYVESHLQENIGLEELAATAGLSMFHFARVFKQSEGVTPHSYLLQRRVSRLKNCWPALTDRSQRSLAPPAFLIRAILLVSFEHGLACPRALLGGRRVDNFFPL